MRRRGPQQPRVHFEGSRGHISVKNAILAHSERVLWRSKMHHKTFVGSDRSGGLGEKKGWLLLLAAGGRGDGVGTPMSPRVLSWPMHLLLVNVGSIRALICRNFVLVCKPNGQKNSKPCYFIHAPGVHIALIEFFPGILLLDSIDRHKLFFSCSAIFDWNQTYKTHDLTDYQLTFGNFLL